MNLDRKHWERFAEFTVMGVILGIIEDLVAVKLATGEKITLDIFLIVLGVTLPFAALSELIVDRKDFLEMLGLDSD